MKKRLLIITDCIDVAANELHATVTTELDRMGSDVIVEPVIKAEPFSVIHGDFLARLMSEIYEPSCLTILSIINPLNPAAHKRFRYAAKLKNGIQLVAPNTGVFTWLIRDFGLKELVEINNTGLKGKDFVSFGGKYIHAPAAAMLAANGNLDEIKRGDLNQVDLFMIEHPTGQVLHIDNFGVSKIRLKKVDMSEGQRALMLINGKTKAEVTYSSSMKELPEGTLALYRGSSFGLFELGMSRTLGTSQKLGLKIGDIVSFTRPR